MIQSKNEYYRLPVSVYVDIWTEKCRSKSRIFEGQMYPEGLHNIFRKFNTCYC
ncbi:hypothetical protein Mapa_009824 [Marchantia paleacea]|nr:hypothetical protein Mapa_009824 [Marchantia paleacea]